MRWVDRGVPRDCFKSDPGQLNLWGYGQVSTLPHSGHKSVVNKMWTAEYACPHFVHNLIIIVISMDCVPPAGERKNIPAAPGVGAEAPGG